jgi:hypothetical protein
MTERRTTTTTITEMEMGVPERAVKAVKSHPSNEHHSFTSEAACVPMKETCFDCAPKSEEQLDIKSESDKLSNQL